MSSRTHRLTPRRNRRPNIGFGKIAAFEHQQARLFRQRREKQVSVIRRRRMAADLAKATTVLNAAARSASTCSPSLSSRAHDSSENGFVIRGASRIRLTLISKPNSTLANPTAPEIGAAVR